MKKIFTLITATFVAVAAYAQTRTTTSIQLVSGDERSSVIRFVPGPMVQTDVITPQGPAVIISVGEGTPILKAGAPDLPQLTASVIIPDVGNTSVEIVSSTWHDIQNVEVAPSKGNLYRNQDPSLVPYTYGEQYGVNSFYPASAVNPGSPYILRDYRGQAIHAIPFQYNPVTKVLRVYDELVIKVTATGGSGLNEFQRIERPIVAEYDHTYRSHFLNYNPQDDTRYTPLIDQGEMLIICHGPFMPAMQSFVAWKNRKGIITTMVDVATVGNSATNIKNYVANYYNSNNLAFVLLVGDHAEVTSSQTTAGPSDNDYAFISGADSYPELLIGRFSAETSSHVTTMVTRTLEYERAPLAGTFYETCMGIGSNQGPGDDNEMDYEHERNIGNLLLTYNYNTFLEVYDGSQGGNDAPGSPGATDVSVPVNAGLGLINYTGHGSTQAFTTTGFSNNDVNALTNTHKWPFIFSVACVNGDFTYSTCFAESWLRAINTTTQEPTGAVTTIMSTINQSWNPPMEGQDEMNAILAETVSGNIRRTFGGIAMNGCMKMNDSYGSAGDEMTDTWTIFGD
ncbi:MAG TPA: C25 family cysteine peptidase, partial [Bacteroidia bacterium]|nr:C25 family cysteine peptidase [Bacteroidia bacterium]